MAKFPDQGIIPYHSSTEPAAIDPILIVPPILRL